MRAFGESLVGVMNYVNLTIWGTSEGGSAYARNNQSLDGFLTRVGLSARAKGEGLMLSQSEVMQAFDEQRWRSFESSQELLAVSPVQNCFRDGLIIG